MTDAVDVVGSLERMIRRDRLWIVLGLAVTIGLAWVYLLREAAAMQAMADETRRHAAMGMAGMTMRTWGVTDGVALFVMWTVMMIGMMLPSTSPVILLVLNSYRVRRDGQASLAAVMFVGGYALVWTAFSALAAGGQVALHRAAILSEDMRLGSAAVSGVVLLIAGIYQWLPIKNRCLTQCRTPLSFLTQRWRPGVQGAFEMGVRHGTYCVGCCWLLMVLLFVLGVMNLIWIAVLAAVVLLEKLSARGVLVSRLAGAAAAGWGAYLLMN